jgi:hypothetical protein
MTFKYEPDAALENTRYRIMWDCSVITDKTIPANRPDITVTDCVNKYTYLIDIDVPETTNLEKTYREKSINTLSWQTKLEEYGTRGRSR